MSVKMKCLDEATLVEFVYDEGSTPAKEALAAHVLSCVICTEEVRALQATREELRAWTPPDAVLGFQVVGPSPSMQATVLRPTQWWRQPLPAWAQAAAAVALFTAGAALGTLRGDTISPGVAAGVVPSAASVATSTSTSTAPSPTSTAPVSVGDLTALEQRLRAEMSQRERAVVPVSAARGASQSDEVLLEQVRALIRESERRQQEELTLRTAELVKDVDAQRRGDMARIERTFGQMEGTTGVQVEQQRQLLNYLVRVSQRQPQ